MRLFNMNRRIIYGLILLNLMLFAHFQVNAQGIPAKIDDILESAFNFMNQGPNPSSANNVNQSASFNAQGRQYYVGGSATKRIQQLTVQPVAITLPSIKAGCEGVDLHLGSIDFAGFDQYKKIFQAIPQTAAAYGMNLALQQISVPMADAFKSVQDVVNKINSGTLDACEISKSLVNGGAGFVKDAIKMKSIGQAANKGYSDMKTRMETAADKFTSIPGVTDDEKKSVEEGQNNVPGSGGKDSPAAPELILDGNILWKALDVSKSGYDISSKEKELLMSIVGTQIILNDPVKIVPVKPTINGFMEFVTGNAEVTTNDPVTGTPTTNLHLRLLECMTPPVDCSVVQTVNSANDGKNTFLALTTNKMKAIKKNILDREKMSDANKEFVQQIRVPIYRLLVIALAANKNSATAKDGLAEVLIDKYKTLIAIESAQLWLHTMLKVLSTSLEMNNQQYQTHIDAAAVLKNRVAQLLRDSEEAHKNESAKLATADSVSREIEALSKSLANNMPANLKKFMSMSK